MLKPYKVICKFYYDGKCENSDSYTMLLEEPLTKKFLELILTHYGI